MARKAKPKMIYSNTGLEVEAVVKDFIAQKGIKQDGRSALYSQPGAMDSDGVMWRIEAVPVPSKVQMKQESQWSFNSYEKLIAEHYYTNGDPEDPHYKQLIDGYKHWSKAFFIMDQQRMTNIHEWLEGRSEHIEFNDNYRFKIVESKGRKGRTIKVYKDTWFIDWLIYRIECKNKGIDCGDYKAFEGLLVTK